MDPSEAPNCLAGRHILVVEDEDVVAMLLAEMLTDLGCVAVGPANDLASALELAHHDPLDAALLDVNLRGERVYPIAHELAGRGIPFILTTGYEPNRLRPPFNTCPVLQKPFAFADLEVCLSTVLRAAAAP